ncbi:MAG: lactate utilization protein [Caldilineaceae bacterium]|nr:lactate utilization protein [Caldilineaceae bacterium]
MSSRERILNSLRNAPQPFGPIEKPATYLSMTPLADRSPAALRQRFIAEAEKLACHIHAIDSAAQALETLLALLAGDERVISWTPELLPLPNLAETLTQAGIAFADPRDPSVRVGLSGVDAALAATGSLVLASGGGQYRTASLLPPVHIALVKESQILSDFEEWMTIQRAQKLTRFRQSSNIVVISGPSRTADIAMQLILGMHGPGELHILLLAD